MGQIISGREVERVAVPVLISAWHGGLSSLV